MVSKVTLGWFHCGKWKGRLLQWSMAEESSHPDHGLESPRSRSPLLALRSVAVAHLGTIREACLGP